MTVFLVPITIGFFMDMLFGDPYSLPHPVCAMGSAIKSGEGIIRRFIKNEKIGGIMLVMLMVLIFTSIPILILIVAEKINPILALVVESIMCWQCLAANGLKKESMKVYNALKTEGVEKSREAVSMIVGRDTQGLNEEGIIKATVETVAENTSDGVIAPMFYMFFGGGVMGYFYKVINTMDSMVGYKNDRYINFGWAAAKLDDIVNFIPSRISGILMVIAAYLLKLNGKNAWKIFKRDRLNHASPNSAQTEAACAGALGVMLAGDAWYFGKLYNKKTIGDSLRQIEAVDIIRVNKLMYGVAFLMLAVLNIFWLL